MRRGLAPSAVLLLCASSAAASGFATARFGGEHGHPTTENPTAIYYNPAGLAASEGTHLFADGLFALRRASYEHQRESADTEEPPDAQGANHGKGTLLNFAAVPMLGASTKIGAFAFGIGAYVPFGGSEVWDDNTAFENDPKYPGPVDGVQRWYDIEGTIQSTYLTAAAAAELWDSGMSIGAGLNLVYSNVNTATARTALGNDDVTLEGRSQLDVSGWQLAFGAGALFEAVEDQLWLGVSYQSRPNVVGGMKLAGELRNDFTGSVDVTEVELHQDLPDVYRAGVRWRPTPEVELRLFGDLTRWSAFTRHCVARKGESCALRKDGSAPPDSGAVQNVPRDCKDAFGVRLGGSYFATRDLELFAGLGYDSNAVPDETLEPSLMDFDDFAAAAGARVAVLPNLFVAGSYTNFYEIPRDTRGKSVHPTEASPSNGPDASGKYFEWVGVLDVNVELVLP